MQNAKRRAPEELGYMRYNVAELPVGERHESSTYEEQLQAGIAQLGFMIAHEIICNKDIHPLIRVVQKDSGQVEFELAVVSISRLAVLLEKERMHDAAVAAVEIGRA